MSRRRGDTATHSTSWGTRCRASCVTATWPSSNWGQLALKGLVCRAIVLGCEHEALCLRAMCQSCCCTSNRFGKYFRTLAPSIHGWTHAAIRTSLRGCHGCADNGAWSPISEHFHWTWPSSASGCCSMWRWSHTGRANWAALESPVDRWFDRFPRHCRLGTCNCRCRPFADSSTSNPRNPRIAHCV